MSRHNGWMDCFVAFAPCANASRLSQAMTEDAGASLPPSLRSIRLRRRVGGADLPEFQQAAGVFDRQLAVLLFCPCQFMAAQAAGGEAAVEHGGDRFPIQPGDAAG